MKHRIVTAAQMKEIEQAGDAHGLPYLQMMENAGLAAYAELQKQFPHPGRLLVVCGKGNNGGDGYRTAIELLNKEYDVNVVQVAGKAPKSEEAKAALAEWEKLGRNRLHRSLRHTEGRYCRRCDFSASVWSAP